MTRADLVEWGAYMARNRRANEVYRMEYGCCAVCGQPRKRHRANYRGGRHYFTP